METTNDIRNTAPTAIPNFNLALQAFLETTQARLNAEYARTFEHVKAPTLSVEKGRVNVRIVASDSPGSSRSVFCFIRIADGAVLKAEGWKKPAKHVRGSIYVNAGQDAINTYGANYITR
jgi:hypothetical protein